MIPVALGSPFLAPGGLALRTTPADSAVPSRVLVRSQVLRVVALLFAFNLASAAMMAVMFYPRVAAGDAAAAALARNIGFGAGVLGLSVAAFTAFYRWYAPITAPAYAVASGVFMAGLALGFEREFPGIALQSVSVAFAAFSVLWMLHAAKLITVGRRFVTVVLAATAAIALVYLGSFLLWLADLPIPMSHQAGTGGILWMGFIVTVASLNLLVDFERIGQLEGRRQPAYMPWLAGLGLLVTLVWLYISMLRLIARIRR